jgi:formate-dependent nitrite reductase membrane component NrfD
MTATYYDLPVLKPPTWAWEAPTYFFVGGAAGASAVIACACERTNVNGGRDGGLARDAKWIAAIGGLSSGALLTAELGRPERFLNMLRVFKLQSPMSVGAWTLTAFSTAAAASAFADLMRERFGDRVAVAVMDEAAGALAAATGLVMTTYTGVLIGATAIPVWNRHARLLPVHFAASALGSAVSLLELRGHSVPALNALGVAAAAVETITGAVVERESGPEARALKNSRSGWVTRAGGVLSGPVPLLLRLAAPRSPAMRRRAAALTVAGALLTRFGWWAAGSESARDAETALAVSRRPA